MREKSEELKTSIKKFYDLLERCPDKIESAFDFVSFLRSFLRIKAEVPLPTIEIMTLIKQKKPTIFYTLRRMSQKDNMLRFLTDLSMELEDAEQKLKNLLGK